MLTTTSSFELKQILKSSLKKRFPQQIPLEMNRVVVPEKMSETRRSYFEDKRLTGRIQFALYH